jgi:hypothetical protein
VFVPLKAMADPAAFKLVTTEVFGPFQVVTEYEGACLLGVVACVSRQRDWLLHHHHHHARSHLLLLTRDTRHHHHHHRASCTDDQLRTVLDLCEAMAHHLTAAVVSNDAPFLQEVLAHTVNGTTYAGLRARTTGAPQNHWFGPAGDPRGAGIGTPEAIRLVWSCHREIITDVGPVTQHAETLLTT